MVESIRGVARDLVREWQADRVSGLAGEIAFFGVLSLFPTLLALAAALGSLQALAGGDLATQAEEEVISFLERILTSEAEGTIDAVRSLFDASSPGALTIGTLAALWAASRGFASVINALDVAYDIEEGRSFVHLRLTAIGMAIGTIVVLALVLAMLVLGPLLGTGGDVADLVGLGGAFATFWDWVRWPSALVLMAAWAATVFHVAPNHKTPWRWDLPGAVLTTVGWAAISLGFRLYLSIAGETNQVLGTLGGALIVLLWLYLLAVALLVGGELNAILAIRHDVVQEPRATAGANLLRLWRRRVASSGDVATDVEAEARDDDRQRDDAEDR